MMRILFFSVLLASFLLAGCGSGGSGGQSSTDTSNSTKGEMQDALIAELEENYGKVADSAYTGKRDLATANFETLQYWVDTGFFEDRLFFLEGISWAFDENGMPEEAGSVNEKLSCSEGSIEIKGTINEDGSGRLTIDYVKCREEFNSSYTDGIVEIVMSVPSTRDDISDWTLAFDGLSHSETYYSGFNGEPKIMSLSLSGYIRYLDDSSIYNVTSKDLDTQEQRYAVYSVAYNDNNGINPLRSKGSVYSSTYGLLTFGVDGSNAEYRNGRWNISDDNQRVTLAEKSLSEPLFYSYLAYELDSNNDDKADLVYWFNNRQDFLESAGDIHLVSPDLVGFPPEVQNVNLSRFREPTTLDEITVDLYTNDRDTPNENITLTYQWFINGVLVEGLSSSTLAPGNAVFGDQVTVKVTASDGVYFTSSESKPITLANAPSQLVPVNFPAVITQGETVSFKMIYRDPDEAGKDLPANLISVPQGMTINDEGIVTWQAQAQTPFDQELIDLGIESPDGSAEDALSFPIRKTQSNLADIKNAPINGNTRNRFFANVTGDEQAEFIHLSSGGVLSIYEPQADTYTRLWQNPYRLAPSNINSIYAINVDDDAYDEIVLVTDSAVMIFDYAEKSVREAFSYSNNIRNVLVGDVDNNGTGDIVYTSYDEDNDYLGIHGLAKGEGQKHQIILTGSPGQMVLGNFDEDPNLEIVTDKGLVYDAATGANQWVKVGGFGNTNTPMRSGDVDGDGASELIVLTNEQLSIYSIDSKSVLLTIPNIISNSNRWGSLNVGDFNFDGIDELVLSGYRSGNEFNIYRYDAMLNEIKEEAKISSDNFNSYDLNNRNAIYLDKENKRSSLINTISTESLEIHDVADDYTLTQRVVNILQYREMRPVGLSPTSEQDVFDFVVSGNGLNMISLLPAKNTQLTTLFNEEAYYNNNALSYGSVGGEPVLFGITGRSDAQVFTLSGDKLWSDELRNNAKAFMADMTGDSQAEFIYYMPGNRSMHVADVENSVLLKSLSFTQDVNQIIPMIKSGGGAGGFVASGAGKLWYQNIDGSQGELLERRCDHITLASPDSFYCAARNSNFGDTRSIKVYGVTAEGNILERNEIATQFEILDMVAYQDKIVLLARQNYRSMLVYMDGTTGRALGRSPELPVDVEGNLKIVEGKQGAYLMFATSQMAYIYTLN